MSELIRYYQLLEEPKLSGSYNTISGKYRIAKSQLKGEPAKYYYEEVYTSPMLNTLLPIDSTDDLESTYQSMIGEIRVKTKIYFEYSEYYYYYYRLDGTVDYYMKAFFNTKQEMDDYVVPSSLSATEISKTGFEGLIVSGAEGHQYTPSEDEDLITQKKIILDDQCDGSTRSFDLGVAIKAVENTAVLFNGQELDNSKEYTIDGSTLTLKDNTPTPDAGDRLTLRYLYIYNNPKGGN